MLWEMGDFFRRLFYPLLLPAIVFAVWANAWSAKLDRTPTRMPAQTPPAFYDDGSVLAQTPPRTGYGFARDDVGDSDEDHSVASVRDPDDE
jgi:hypothetical protein